MELGTTNKAGSKDNRKRKIDNISKTGKAKKDNRSKDERLKHGLEAEKHVMLVNRLDEALTEHVMNNIELSMQIDVDIKQVNFCLVCL